MLEFFRYHFFSDATIVQSGLQTTLFFSRNNFYQNRLFQRPSLCAENHNFLGKIIQAFLNVRLLNDIL